MIRVKVYGVAVDVSQQPVILLQAIGDPERAGRVMPVWIGPQEATSILVAVQGASIGRPLSHDLMATLLRSTDSRIDYVVIPRITEGTFYAEIALVTPKGTETLDARPSDAIALASRVDAPLWVAEDVYDQVSVETEVQSEDEEEEIAQFRDFVEHVDPEEFQKWTD
ncbi:bifunctional nuclease family protein [Brevibacterium daeguense]|uniref:Bifunctional nuclease family protein n=1 Tax=Brevibacterium daeguense TaxID=909936 RepID=A0ABP8EHE7_9MICO